MRVGLLDPTDSEAISSCTSAGVTSLMGIGGNAAEEASACAAAPLLTSSPARCAEVSIRIPGTIAHALSVVHSASITATRAVARGEKWRMRNWTGRTAACRPARTDTIGAVFENIIFNFVRAPCSVRSKERRFKRRPVPVSRRRGRARRHRTSSAKCANP